MKKNEIFIRHIFDEINFVMDKSKGLKYENLMKDETLKRAFLRSLEIIGAATKNLIPRLKEQIENILKS